MRLATAAVLAACALVAGCVCHAIGGSMCQDSNGHGGAPLRDYRYDVSTDDTCSGLVLVRVAGGDGAKKHAEVPASLFDYLELHAHAPPSKDPVADAPTLSVWLRRDTDETFYGYVLELKKGVRTAARVACASGKPVVANVEYVTP